MNKLFFLYAFLFISYPSSSQTLEFHPKHIRKTIPKDVPEMVLVRGKTDTARYENARYSSAQNAPSYYMSKFEITNQDFCKFLNVDSIGGDPKVLEEIIKLDGNHCKIIRQAGRYKPVKGYEKFPVVMVSWYGAVYYCEWLTAYVNTRLEEKGCWRLPNYRLPSEFEWVYAANGRDLKGLNGTMCDSIATVSPTKEEGILKSTCSSKPTSDKIFGINDNAIEWTNDNYYGNIGVLMDFGMLNRYYEEETPEAVTRKHGLPYNENLMNSCGREGRTRAHYFPDTGFRIVQTYLGRSSGFEF